jgi:hypothetical protein
MVELSLAPSARRRGKRAKALLATQDVFEGGSIRFQVAVTISKPYRPVNQGLLIDLLDSEWFQEQNRASHSEPVRLASETQAKKDALGQGHFHTHFMSCPTLWWV